MAREIMCQMGNCLEMVGGMGVSVTLRTKDRNDEQRAVFCSATHAALSMIALAVDRGELPSGTVPGPTAIPRNWKSA